MRRKISVTLLFMIVLLYVGISYGGSTDESEARNVSDKINTLMSKGEYSTVWSDHMSNSFGSTMTKDSFLANLSIGRSMFGKRVNSKFIESVYSTTDPASGYQGDIFSFTYLNTYTGVKMYERIVVINEGGLGFKLAGFWGNPA